ncbi:MAG: hypothetical protein U5Q44_12055 [Dehalococcoidia bacterium]|nr:hypothetical protein [Dehalococcoidia bacterium]
MTVEKALEQLAETPTTLAHLLAEASEEVLDHAEQGGWSGTHHRGAPARRRSDGDAHAAGATADGGRPAAAGLRPGGMG